MPRPSLQNALIENGLALIHKQGFAASGVASIAEAASAPKGSFYNHFKSKDDFGAAILKRYFEDVSAALVEEISRPDRNGLLRLTAYFRRLRDYNASIGFERGCLIGNMSGEASQISKKTRRLLNGMLAEWSAMLASAIARGQKDGSINCALAPAEAASLLLDSWQGALLRSKVTLSAAPQDQFIQLLMPAILTARN